MRLNRQPGSVARLVSVTAVAAATCTLWALPAGAASAATVTKANSVVSVYIHPKTAYVKQEVNLEAVVSSSSTPTGTVKFYRGSFELCSFTLSRASSTTASGSCNYAFQNTGVLHPEAVYSGDATHNGATGEAKVTILATNATTTTIDSITPDPDLAGHAATVKVTVSSSSGTPTGTVKVAPTSPTGLPPSYSCTATLSDGTGSCNVTPGAGTYGDVDYEATYSGDSGHSGSTSTGSHVLIVPETTTTTAGPTTAPAGDAIPLTADVVGQAKDNISPSAGGTGTVTFSINGAVPTGCSKDALTYDGNGNNDATCAVSLPGGSYTLKAAYSGDPNNLASSDTITLIVTTG